MSGFARSKRKLSWVTAQTDNGFWLSGLVYFKDRFDFQVGEDRHLDPHVAATVLDLAERRLVQFFTGLVEAPPLAVAQLLRSSGAVGGGPLMSIFSETGSGPDGYGLRAVGVPLYLAWLGRAEQQAAQSDGPRGWAPLPWWLAQNCAGAMGANRFDNPETVATWRAQGPAPPGSQSLGRIIQRPGGQDLPHALVVASSFA